MKDRQEARRRPRQPKLNRRRLSTEPQERRLSDVQFLILALVQNGLCTAYDLKAKAGISVGTSIPVLAHLQNAQLVRQTATDQRNTRRYLITPAGAETLKAAWRTCPKLRPAHIDSIIRVAYLTWILGNDREAASFLRRAAMILRARATTLQAQASELFHGIRQELYGNGYRWLRTCCDAARMEASAEALTQMADQICGMGNAGPGRKQNREPGARH